MRKDDLIYVGHMLDTARSIVSKMQGIDRAAYDLDENLRLAVAHLIQIIGEAAARVSNEYRDSHANIPWRAIVGMRQKIVHDYLHVDYEIVWGVATTELTALIEQLELLVPN
jgi:uncharacterized protein with HEPN domain